MKPDYKLNDLIVDSEFIETKNSGIVKYTFASFGDLEKFWIGNFDYHTVNLHDACSRGVTVGDYTGVVRDSVGATPDLDVKLPRKR